MNQPIIMQASQLDRLQSVSRYLSREGTGWELLSVMLGMLAVAALTVMLYKLDKRRRRQDLREPGKLFRRLQSQLDLPLRQRDMLRRLAADLRLENPTVLLLGRSVFESHAERWIQSHRRVREVDHENIAALAALLFPPV